MSVHNPILIYYLLLIIYCLLFVMLQQRYAVFNNLRIGGCNPGHFSASSHRVSVQSQRRCSLQQCVLHWMNQEWQCFRSASASESILFIFYSDFYYSDAKILVFE